MIFKKRGAVMEAVITSEELFFFHEKIDALPLYEALRKQLYRILPDTKLKIQKTQIGLYNRLLFGAVSFLPVRKAKERPKTYITVTIGLEHRLDSSRIAAAVEPYPARWTHHVLVSSPEEIDGELLGWLEEAAAFSASKR